MRGGEGAVGLGLLLLVVMASGGWGVRPRDWDTALMLAPRRRRRVEGT